jgi:hypothetical protein
MHSAGASLSLLQGYKLQGSKKKSAASVVSSLQAKGHQENLVRKQAA